MRDDYQLEEVSGAVSLGLLASDIVIATSKLLCGADLSDPERRALEGGEALLRTMSVPLDDARRSHRLGQLGLRSSAIDALHAVQARMPGEEDIQEHVVPLADAVRQVLEGTAVAAHTAELESVRDLFALLGEMEVSRVTNLSRPTPDMPPWLTSVASSSS
jgi:hypothetical protein